MENLVTAFRELDADDLDVMADEFYQRTEKCLDAGKSAWARVYALIACAAIDALDGK
ncbi:hypothetical protein U2F26_28410 [Micromonospora sp. 4G57]|uniref:Uncharacterized protein n=1 Tax=Micromonospora sicca TaxID=2202420 RepID=A0ABU5JKY4_9ACTN|nr:MULTISPECIES: hypothetical protein [unclassified Micromonospora]MDZ5446601.1 hypothetical protein [Micromonospora sp. 4G57]MDZ5493287.1 hypothetical protein [Micromonospora sp. 4G53]